MTKIEKETIEAIQASLELLRNAIVKRDPLSEIEVRTRDILLDVRSLAEGRAYLVTGI